MRKAEDYQEREREGREGRAERRETSKKGLGTGVEQSQIKQEILQSAS